MFHPLTLMVIKIPTIYYLYLYKISGEKIRFYITWEMNYVSYITSLFR